MGTLRMALGWEKPGVMTGFPQRVLSCANAAGRSAANGGFGSQGMEGP